MSANKTRIQMLIDDLNVSLAKTGQKRWGDIIYEEEEEEEKRRQEYEYNLFKEHAKRVKYLISQGLYELEDGEIIE